MPIQVSCPCGKTMRVPDEHAGKRAKCPGCGEVLVIPAANGTSGKAPPPKPQAGRSAPPPPPQTTPTPPGIVCSCDECGRTIRAKLEQAGKRVKCPDCGSVVAIPGDEDNDFVDSGNNKKNSQRITSAKGAAASTKALKGLQSTNELDEDGEETGSKSSKSKLNKKNKNKKKSKAGSGTLLWVGIGTGALALLGGLVFAGFYFLGGSSSGGGEKALLAPDAALVGVLKVKELWKTSLVQELYKLAPKTPDNPVEEMAKAGLSLDDIEHFGIVLKDLTPARGWGYLTTTKPVDTEKALTALEMKPEKKTHEGSTYYVAKMGNNSLYFANPKLVVFGSDESNLKEAIDRLAGRKKPTGNSLARALDQVGNHQVVLGFTVPSMLKGMGGPPGGPGGRQMPPPGGGMQGGTAGIQGGTVGIQGGNQFQGGNPPTGQPGGRPGVRPGGRPGINPGAANQGGFPGANQQGGIPGGPGGFPGANQQGGGPGGGFRGGNPGGPPVGPGGPGMMGGGNPLGKLVEMTNGVITLDIQGNTLSLNTNGQFAQAGVAQEVKTFIEDKKKEASALLLVAALGGQVPKQVTDALNGSKITQRGDQVDVSISIDVPPDMISKAMAGANLLPPGGPPGRPNIAGGGPPQFPGNPGGNPIGDAANRAKLGNNLKMMALAFLNLTETSNGAAPSVFKPQGKPFSWRVAILPFMEAQNVQNQLKLNEPWDSPHNLQVAKTSMPKVFESPGRPAQPGETFFKTFTGPDTMFSGILGSFYLRDSTTAPIKSTIPKGTSNTILFVESSTPVIWTKPEEIEFNPQLDVASQLYWNGGKTTVIMADGSVRTISQAVAAEELRNAINQKSPGIPKLD